MMEKLAREILRGLNTTAQRFFPFKVLLFTYLHVWAALKTSLLFQWLFTISLLGLLHMVTFLPPSPLWIFWVSNFVVWVTSTTRRQGLPIHANEINRTKLVACFQRIPRSHTYIYCHRIKIFVETRCTRTCNQIYHTYVYLLGFITHGIRLA